MYQILVIIIALVTWFIFVKLKEHMRGGGGTFSGGRGSGGTFSGGRGSGGTFSGGRTFSSTPRSFPSGGHITGGHISGGHHYYPHRNYGGYNYGGSRGWYPYWFSDWWYSDWYPYWWYPSSWYPFNYVYINDNTSCDKITELANKLVDSGDMSQAKADEIINKAC